jgi:hypothetical protein
VEPYVAIYTKIQKTGQSSPYKRLNRSWPLTGEKSIVASWEALSWKTCTDSRHSTRYSSYFQCTVLLDQTPFRTKGNVAVFGLLYFMYSLVINSCVGTLYSTRQHLCTMCNLYSHRAVYSTWAVPLGTWSRLPCGGSAAGWSAVAGETPGISSSSWCTAVASPDAYQTECTNTLLPEISTDRPSCKICTRHSQTGHM